MKFQKLTIWQIDAAGAGLCLVLLAVFYFGALAPLLREREAINDRRLQFDRERRKASSLTAAVRKLQSQRDAIHAEVSGNPLRLEDVRHINARVARIASLAGAHDIELRDIEPGRPAVSARYETLPIQLSGTGRYGDCVLFLHDLHKYLGDIGVSSFSLSGNPEEPRVPASFHFDLIWYASASSEASAR